MIKRFFSFILLLAGFCSILSAQKDASDSYRINWVTSDSETVTPFSEDYFENETISSNGLPQYIISQNISGSPERASASLINSTVGIYSSANFAEEISSDFQIKTDVKYAGNQAMAIVYITPLRSNNGIVERLESFDLEISTSGTRVRAPRTRSAGNSVLSEGTWLKISIEEDGIYRLGKAFFDEAGLDSDDINPNQVNVYGNTGDMLPFDNSVFRHDDLVLNPILFEGDSDNNFENGEYFLFYGDGPAAYTYTEGDDILNFKTRKHNYSDAAFYFVRVDDVSPLRMDTQDEILADANYTSTSFDDFSFHETESVNLIKSGREWFGENFNISTQLLLNFNFPNALPETGHIEICTASRSLGGSSSFDFSVDNEPNVNLSMGATGSSVISNVANLGCSEFSFTPSSGNIQVSIDYNKFNQDSEGWLNYVALQCRRELKMAGNFMDFRDQRATNFNTSEYQILEVFNANNFSIWNITDPVVAKAVPFTVDNNTATFKSQADELETFIAFNNSAFLTPTFINTVENQNLHALSDIEMIIVANRNLLSAAENLAQFHTDQGMAVAVTTPELIYNEFSSGNPDVTAIKMLMKMLYDDAAGDEELAPKYLCIIGDGTYQNRNISSASANVISFQSLNSISPTNSYISDDYFGYLDDDESELPTDKMDIGIGRIVARSSEEAQQMVDKIINYASGNSTTDGGAFCVGDGTNSPYGSWRNKIVFVADDQDGNTLDFDIHMKFSDELADTIQMFNNEFNIDKIYSDAYQQISTPGGERYDEAKDKIERVVQDGALLVNYIGHGGEKGWAHERILDIPTIRGWTNSNRLPVFVTATCELTRYDDPDFLSAGELIYLNPDGGAIAMLTTTRIVFSGSNQALARAFYSAGFGTESHPNLTLGKIYQQTKNAVNGVNQKNFSLLGDPALVMAHPKESVFTSEINGIAAAQFTDTLKALQTVTVKGFVANNNGEILTDFNGFVYPTVYDKERQLFSLANDATGDNGVLPYPFKLSNSVLYNGKASAENGEFEFTFVIPKDINYQIGLGRISYYAVDGSLDGHGEYSAFKIGSSANDIELNDQGPLIELFLNDEAFISGGLTDETPILLASLEDENGINTVGNGIGHDLKAVIDENTSQAIILNDYYESDEDSYQSGQIRFQLSELEEGKHTLSLKAWDTHNNSSEELIEFSVVTSEELALDHVLNYPNPFTTSTEFMFEHNAACNTLDVQIQVFTIAGNLVKTINERINSSGYRANGIMWNGRDDFGDELARGVYVYKVEITTPEGLNTEEFQKLVLLK
ncbi:MAG: type IX secretion system sortase PorU [Flavobacteriales bacterium]